MADPLDIIFRMIAQDQGVQATIATLTVGIGKAIDAFEDLAERGIKTNAAFENIELGIATVIGSVTELSDTLTGAEFTTGPDKLAAASGIAADQMRKLRIDALETAATVRQIAPAFQAAIGPGVKAGLTIDQIRKVTIDITNAVKAIGLPLDQINQETRAILSGEIDRHAQVALVLGITREQIREAVKQNKLADLLNEKLKVAAASGKETAKTFSGALSNLQEAADVFALEVTEGLFEKLRKKLNDVFSNILKGGEITKELQGLENTLENLFNRIGDISGTAIDTIISVVKRFSASLETNKAQVDRILDSMTDIGVQLVLAVERTFAWADALRNGQDIFVFINGVLRGIEKEIADLSTFITIVLSRVAQGVEGLFILILSGIEGIATAVGASGVEKAVREQIAKLEKGIHRLNGVIDEAIEKYDELIARQKLLAENPLFSAAQGQRLLDLDQKDAGTKRAPKPDETKITTKPKLKPDKGAERAAERAAKQASDARIKLKEAEAVTVKRLVEEAVEAAEAAYRREAITATQMIAKIIEAEKRLLEAKQAAIGQEREETTKAKLPEEARAAKLAALREEELQNISVFNRKVAKLRDDAFLKEDDAIKKQLLKAQEDFLDHQDRLLDIAEIGRKARADAERAAAEKGTVSFESVERNATKGELQGFKDREDALKRELASLDLSETRREQINDALARLAAERAAFEEASSRRVQDAIQKDIDKFQEYADRRQEIQDAITEAQLEAQSAVEQLRGRSKNPVQQDLAQLNQINIQQQKLELEHKRRLDDIDAQRRASIKAGVEAGINKKLAEYLAQQQANKQIEAEQARHNAEMGQLEQDRKDVIPDPSEIFSSAMREAFDGFSAGLGDIAEQWILTGEISGKAARQMTAAVLAGLAKQAIVKSLFNLAEGLAALANPATAFLAPGYFAAAKAFAVVAAVAGVAGRAIAGNTAKQTGGASGSQSSQDAQSQQQQTPEPLVFTRGVIDGLVGGFKEAVNPLVRGQQQQTSVMEKQATATEKFNATAERLGIMKPGELVVMMGEQNPRAFADATARGIGQSQSAKRAIRDNIAP